MILPWATELKLVGVVDAGVPNNERIGLQPTEPVNLAQFGLIIGMRHPNGAVLPLRDNFFWFGDLVVEPPSWVVVFTGEGNYHEWYSSSGDKVHTLYWGRKVTMFGVPNIVPVLIRIDGILIADTPTLPALSR
jgi:hypothetical protein